MLLGRAVELEALTGVLDRASTGRGASALVEGEAGVGKTTLVAAVADAARERGFIILEARAEELERGIPFSPLVSALQISPTSPDPDRANVARMLGAGGNPLDMSRTEQALGIIVDALIRVVEPIAMAGPTLLLFEDLHWADRPSLTVALAFVRRLSDLPLCVIATTRPGLSPEIQHLAEGFRRADAAFISLDPLDEDSVLALVSSLLEAEPGPRLLARSGSAQGNPLYVTELMRALQADGVVSIADGIAEVPEDAPLPASIRQTILRRLADLSSDSLDTLRSASLLGTTFAASDLAAILGRKMFDLEHSLREPLAAGVLIPSDDRLAFRHDVVREAIYEDIPESVRKGLHREVARALEQAGAPVTQIAEHLVRGASRGDREAIERIRQAAYEVMRTDLLASEHLLRKLFELYEPSDPERDTFLGFVLEEQFTEKRWDEIKAYIREKLERDPPPVAEVSLRGYLGDILWRQGEREPAIAEFERVLEIRGIPRWQELDRLLLTHRLLALAGDRARALTLSDRALALGEEWGDPWAIGYVLVTKALFAYWDGRFSEALELNDQAVQVSRRAGPADSSFIRAMILSAADRFDEAMEAQEEGIRFWVQGQGQSMGLIQMVIQAAMKLDMGSWDDAYAEFAAAREMVEERREDGVIWPYYGLAVIERARGNTEAFGDLVGRAMHELERGGVTTGADAAVWSRAVQLEDADEVPEALALLKAWWQPLQSLRNPTILRRFAPDAVRIALACGDTEFARMVTEDMEAFAERAGPVPSARGAALRSRGLLERDADRLVEALEAYREVTERVYERALVAEDAANALVEAGRASHARRYFDEAIDIYEQIGATAYAARAAASMREAGLRRGARGKRGRPTAGWDSLTPTEAQIVDLVVSGLRYSDVAAKLFISPHTVSTHLRHVFGKLGISSRFELAAEHAKRASQPIG